LATLGLSVFAVLLLAGQRGRGRGALLLIFVAVSAAWAGTCTAFAVTPNNAAWRVAHILDVLRLGSGLAFLLLMLGRIRRGVSGDGTSPVKSRARFAALVLFLLATALFAEAPYGEVESVGTAANSTAWALLILRSVLGLILVEQLYRGTDPVLRWNVKPLVLGMGGVFFYDLMFYSDALLFRALDPSIWAGRGLANALVIPLLGVAAARNREWDFSVALSRHVLAGSTALFSSGIYLLALAGVGYYVRFFGGTWGRALEFVLIFAGVLLLGLVIFSGRLRSKLRVLIGKHFFAYRYDYRVEWLKFVSTLSVSSVRTTQEQCIQALADLVESPGGALWIRGPDDVFVPAARLNMPAVNESEPSNSALPTYLARTGWVIDVNEARSHPGEYDDLVLPLWLRTIPTAWLIAPLSSGEELIGFVVLAQPRVRLDLNWEVRDILKTGGRQAGSYLALLEATEALLEAKKFDAFNRMSAFVVHDLKNLITQLQLMLRNAARHHDNPEFQRDMLGTVRHVVDRMNQLMLQLRGGATPIESPRPVDLAAVARKVRALRVNGAACLETELTAGVWVLGHEDQLERVIGHLVQNGLEAVRDNPRVTLRVFREGTSGVVEVDDNGIGMAPEFIRNRLFKPFQTTKSMGMGIGAYESNQYVNGLGGRIAVHSEPNAGTRVSVQLPLMKTERPPAGAES
jgi:putative PEP-CTERM system histidine kinase